MKGFILSLHRAKNEDMVVTILSGQHVCTYYRFFGARHSILQLGNLIDFEVEGEQDRFMPRVRSVSHLGFPWIYDNNLLLMWHNYIKLYQKHLKDTEDIESFYFDLLLSAAQKWHLQNPKRVICEDYLKILSYEGRLHDIQRCYVCEEPIAEEVSLMRAFIPAHPHCISSASLKRVKLNTLFDTGKSIYLEDSEVEYLHSIVMQGF